MLRAGKDQSAHAMIRAPGPVEDFCSRCLAVRSSTGREAGTTNKRPASMIVLLEDDSIYRARLQDAPYAPGVSAGCLAVLFSLFSL